MGLPPGSPPFARAGSIARACRMTNAPPSPRAVAERVGTQYCRLCPPSLHHEEAEVMRYLPLSDADRGDMLAAIGASSIDDLFRDVPRKRGSIGPIEGLPMHACEMAVERQMRALARKNLAAGDAPFFLGCGAYRHHVPASVDHLIQRGEFLTAYTPYQPEIAQGTLQVLFEFQSQVARLSAARSPTPPCTTARPPAGKRSRWRGGSRGGSGDPLVGPAPALCRGRADDGQVHRRCARHGAAGAYAEHRCRAADRRDRRRDQRGGGPISRHPRPHRRPRRRSPKPRTPRARC